MEEDLPMELQPGRGQGRGYREGRDWSRGAVLGTGAFSTCYQVTIGGIAGKLPKGKASLGKIAKRERIFLGKLSLSKGFP